MPEGEFFGIDRPFVKNDKLLLKFDINIVRQNAATFDTPENRNKLSERIADASGYIERNITVFRSDAPATAVDFIAVVRPATGEFWNSIDRSVQSILKEVNEMDNVEITQPVPMCSTVDTIIKDNTSGREIL